MRKWVVFSNYLLSYKLSLFKALNKVKRRYLAAFSLLLSTVKWGQHTLSPRVSILGCRGYKVDPWWSRTEPFHHIYQQSTSFCQVESWNINHTISVFDTSRTLSEIALSTDIYSKTNRHPLKSYAQELSIISFDYEYSQAFKLWLICSNEKP